jgi:D-alanine--poly(phosphoribitol) ligase subunit 1
VNVQSVNLNLVSAFYSHAMANPERLALLVDANSYSYGELAGVSQQVARLLGRPARVGVLASRTLEAYAGVLGTLWAGAAYVPINPNIPDERLIQILRITSLDAVVADAAGLERLKGRVAEFTPPLVLGAADFRDGEFNPEAQTTVVSDDDLAYIIFTSGTTGVPKGVMIETGSVVQLIEVMQRRFGFRADDRVSQASELTFDVSVFDMLMTWSAGAALYVVPAAQLMAPGKFIKDNQLTIWFSVPSIALFMQRIRMLTPGAFPWLRFSLFAGEALPLASAQAWQAAAPNSSVENLYGPTEATVICIGQRLTEPPNITANRGVLAIGDPFEGVGADVLDSSLSPVAGTEPGELVVSGRQLAKGYFNDPEMTAARFPVLRGKRWYRTGDLACRDRSGKFHHLGRIDNQVKVLGNRVELEEVEAHLRAITNTDLIVAIAWPIVDGSASGIVAFLAGSHVTMQAARAALRQRIPSYMVPRQLLEIDSMPLGPTGKFDRKALLLRLQQASAKTGL